MPSKQGGTLVVIQHPQDTPLARHGRDRDGADGGAAAAAAAGAKDRAIDKGAFAGSEQPPMAVEATWTFLANENMMLKAFEATQTKKPLPKGAPGKKRHINSKVTVEIFS